MPSSNAAPRKPRARRALLRVGLGGLLLSGGAVAASALPARDALVTDRAALYADGHAVARARVEARNLFGGAAWLAPRGKLEVDREAAASLGATVLPAHDGSLVVRAGHRAGSLELRLIDDEGRTLERAELTLHADPSDRDEDGLPDVAELVTEEERAAFTAWFTAIAEAQATALDDRWAKVHQDCAGLVRFAFREALKTHDREWLSRWRYLPSVSAPDVASMRYPELPFIGALPFRKVGGAFDASVPIEEQLTAAASARTLWQQNSALVSRDIADARAGDLLFFQVPHATGSRMHTMIALGARPGASHHERATRVVYHTGTRAEDGREASVSAEGAGTPRGQVKLVTLEALAQHPDAGWHPVPSNPRFLGVFRLIHVVHQEAPRGLALRPAPGGGS